MNNTKIMPLFLLGLRRWAVLSLLGFGLLALMGCGTQEDTKKEVHIGLSGGLAVLDPHFAVFPSEQYGLSYLTEGLFELNEQEEAVNALAQSLSHLGQGVYQIRLGDVSQFSGQKLIFSDGTPVTAKTFVASFKRAIDPQTLSPLAFMFDFIEGAEAIRKGQAPLSSLKIEALDAQTLILTTKLLDQPEVLKQILTHRVFVPIWQGEKDASDESSDQAFVGNGRYVIEEDFEFAYWELKPRQKKLPLVFIYDMHDLNFGKKNLIAGVLDEFWDTRLKQINWRSDSNQNDFQVQSVGQLSVALQLGNKMGGMRPKIWKGLSNLIQTQSMQTRFSEAEILNKKGLAQAEDELMMAQAVLLYQHQQALEKAKQWLLKQGYSKDNPFVMNLSIGNTQQDKNLLDLWVRAWRSLPVALKPVYLDQQALMALQNSGDYKALLITRVWQGSVAWHDQTSVNFICQDNSFCLPIYNYSSLRYTLKTS